MTFTIRPLEPSLAQTYVDFLSAMDFHHAPDWAGCFCRFYHTDCSSEDWQKRSSEENKQDAFNAIRNGSMKGYLAFDQDKVIGWVNANAVQAYPRLYPIIKPYMISPKSGTVVCFVIHPDYRRQGVASALLQAAVDGFEKEGYASVLGNPFENQEKPEKAYHGTLGMYERAGFKILEQQGSQAVMRKDF